MDLLELKFTVTRKALSISKGLSRQEALVLAVLMVNLTERGCALRGSDLENVVALQGLALSSMLFGMIKKGLIVGVDSLPVPHEITNIQA